MKKLLSEIFTRIDERKRFRSIESRIGSGRRYRRYASASDPDLLDILIARPWASASAVLAPFLSVAVTALYFHTRHDIDTNFYQKFLALTDSMKEQFSEVSTDEKACFSVDANNHRAIFYVKRDLVPNTERRYEGEPKFRTRTGLVGRVPLYNSVACRSFDTDVMIAQEAERHFNDAVTLLEASIRFRRIRDLVDADDGSGSLHNSVQFGPY